jgi:hypothetical protein
MMSIRRIHFCLHEGDLGGAGIPLDAAGDVDDTRALLPARITRSLTWRLRGMGGSGPGGLPIVTGQLADLPQNR